MWLVTVPLVDHFRLVPVAYKTITFNGIWQHGIAKARQIVQLIHFPVENFQIIPVCHPTNHRAYRSMRL
jgi:hypothetical protein